MISGLEEKLKTVKEIKDVARLNYISSTLLSILCHPSIIARDLFTNTRCPYRRHDKLSLSFIVRKKFSIDRIFPDIDPKLIIEALHVVFSSENRRLPFRLHNN